VSTAIANTLSLHYRVSFVILMLLAGLAMSTGGVLIVIGSVVLFRPAAIFLGILLGLGGLRLLRRYGGTFLRRQAAFQFDEQGLHYVAANGYVIPWSNVLGVHAVRRGDRVTDVFFYLTESPINILFMGDTDPRAALFSGHRPESPNQLHLRLRHFDTSQLGDAEAAFRAFAPRRGAFPDNTKILDGHLSLLNWVFFTLLITVVIGGIAASIAVSVATWPIGLLVFALFQSLTLLVWAGGRAKRLWPGWATPRLIASGGTLYLPGAALGSVKLNEVLNIRYRLGTLRLFFNTPQESVQDSQYNPYGIFARATIATRGDSYREMMAFFSPLHVWDNGKKPDLKQAKEMQKRHDEEMRDLLVKHKKKPKNRLHHSKQ
jgi:hypothetical protein